MQFLAALLPVAIYLFVVYQIDNFSLLSIKRLLLLIVCGMLTALACFGLFTLHPSPFTLHQRPLHPLHRQPV